MSKVSESDVAEFCAQLLDDHEDETARFQLASGERVDALGFTGPFGDFILDQSRVAASTVMCPTKVPGGNSTPIAHAPFQTD
jgi:hypothetical protein